MTFWTIIFCSRFTILCYGRVLRGVYTPILHSTQPMLTYDAVKHGFGGSGYAAVRWHRATYGRNYVITIVLSAQLPFMNLNTYTLSGNIHGAEFTGFT